ncbi:cephalosporin hydroxylase [Beggiatoa alba B18LD]|uniref:Cephalosporin hydroxylase n=1 Tax=Beggiatoa alba B18LD TaxID=395493 RepID=I3CHN3_9GAMM|nr:CmcI family methyltransferase [Beggiatoa alba]EIJ43126.1 cephalosporin hydroxylase [Beggiatoa alba B18LD]
MKLVIDTEEKTLVINNNEKEQMLDLYSKEAFEFISHQWLKVGWNQKYPYTFSWLGRPIIQIPEDMIRTQEVIYRVKPDVIVETGIAHGGSLIYYASLCKIMGKGRIIGVDIEIRPHNRQVIESHELFPYITLIEGSSIAENIVATVKSLIKPHETVLVILDSNHIKAHVLAELNAYYALVSPNSYIVATDGSMQYLYDVPRGTPEWISDNPTEAAKEFVKAHPEFVIEQPEWGFNESELTNNITHWPQAWLRRK